MTQLARQARRASRELAKLTTAEKNACLLAMATALEQNAAALKQANALTWMPPRIRPFIRHAGPAQAGRQTHRRHGARPARSSAACPIRSGES